MARAAPGGAAAGNSMCAGLASPKPLTRNATPGAGAGSVAGAATSFGPACDVSNALNRYRPFLNTWSASRPQLS
jgi:hypothetical protein